MILIQHSSVDGSAQNLYYWMFPSTSPPIKVTNRYLALTNDISDEYWAPFRSRGWPQRTKHLAFANTLFMVGSISMREVQIYEHRPFSSVRTCSDYPESVRDKSSETIKRVNVCPKCGDKAFPYVVSQLAFPDADPPGVKGGHINQFI